MIWNRTDSGLSKRLDHYTFVVLDAKRHEVFKSKGNPAPAESVKIALGDDVVGDIRAAAIKAAVAMPKQQTATFCALVDLDREG